MVNIEPTHRCNLHCVYCDKAGLRGPQMATEAALDLIDQLAEAGTLSVCFDGGEPLVHPGIESMVRRAKQRGLRVSMSTNGHLLPTRPGVLNFVDKIKISIDGTREIHDVGRGTGSFDRALAGARFAIAAGTSVALRMTLAAHNLEHFRAVVELAKELGIVALFQPAIGDVLDVEIRPAEHSASSEGYRSVIDELSQMKADGEPIGNEQLCLRHLRHWPEPEPVPFCSGGRIEVAIGPEGGMYPCGRKGRRQAAPNVFELGVVEAFGRVQRPTDCANCWCALTLAGCYLHRGDLRLIG
jgi:MoaA/NifB/PqqE/SkfB family radical SAM enzyme